MPAMPIREHVADEVQGACGENGVVCVGEGKRAFQRGRRVADNFDFPGVMAGHLFEQRRGNGAGLAGLRENNDFGPRKEAPGNFVD